jgi:hypothetical protein
MILRISGKGDNLPVRSRNFHVARVSLRLRDRLPALRHTFQMKGNRLLHFSLDFIAGLASSYATIEIWRVCRIARSRFLNDNQILFHFLIPACFHTLFSVPMPRSSPGFPGTVTKPGFAKCLYWRWLPLVRSRRHPSRSSCLITSRTFILRPVANPHALIAIPYTLLAASSIASARVGWA